MSDDNLTPVDSPSTGDTDGAGPDNALDVAPGSDAAEPTVEELARQNDRLRANLKGRQKETERWKTRAGELEGVVGSYQRMTPQQQLQYQPQVPQGPSDEDLAKAEHQAILDGRFDTLAEIRRAQRQRTLQEAQQGQVALLTQLGQAAQSNTLTSSYLSRMGIAPNTEQDRAFRSRLEEMRRDPEYADMAQNSNALARLAAAEVSRDFTGRKSSAKERDREDSAADAHTESARSSTAAVPGRTIREPNMYFTDQEAKYIAYIARQSGKREDEIRKETWARLGPAEKEKRSKNRGTGGELFAR